MKIKTLVIVANQENGKWVAVGNINPEDAEDEDTTSMPGLILKKHKRPEVSCTGTTYEASVRNVLRAVQHLEMLS